MHIELLPAAGLPRAREAWLELEAAGAVRSLTTSWVWTQTWLEHFGDDVAHEFALARDGGRNVAIALLTRSGDRLRGRTVHVGTSGEPHGSTVWVERNDLVALPGHAEAFGAALQSALASLGGWDRLALDGFRSATAAHVTASDGGWASAPEECPVTDLEAVRVAGELAAVLPSRRRQRLRRTMRDLPGLESRVHEDAESALAAFATLTALHRARWDAAGCRTVFADPRFVGFHRALIARLAPRGQAWIHEVRREDATLAALYCLADGARVLFYQSGIRQLDDSRLSPGIAAHALCIEACAERGFALYDMLAPADRYKQDLATGSDELVWATLERSNAASRLRAGVRTLRARLS